MSADLLALLDQLDEARAKATPGPWRQDDEFPQWFGTGESTYIGTAPSGDNAALIVAEHNALPKLTAALRAALDVHGAINAVQYLGTRQVPRRVCTGCGSDDGNWQLWPCPTVTAIIAALTAEPVQP